MTSTNHPWEQIFRKQDWGSKEPFPRFFEVVKHFLVHECKHILDLGCGNGRHLIQFLKEGLDVVGMDISISALRLAWKWAREEKIKAKLLQADMRLFFPFQEGVFDGVFSNQVIHHARIADVRRTISEIYRILGSGGWAFITVSGKVDVGIGHQQIEPGTYIPLSGLEKGLPHHIFSEEEIRMEFDDFQVEEISSRAGGKVIAVMARKP